MLGVPLITIFAPGLRNPSSGRVITLATAPRISSLGVRSATRFTEGSQSSY
jgi:hypothetical protein